MDTYNISMFSIYLAVLILFWIGFSEYIRISNINKDSEALLKIKKQKLPRIPFACIACMYLYLLAAALRLFLFPDSLRYGGQIFDFIAMFTVICILSGFNLTTIQILYNIGMSSHVKKGWIALKLAFLPFLPLNAWLFDNTMRYIDSEVIGYALLIIAFWPFYLLLASLIPLIFPVVINVMNGYIGVSYICQLRQQTGNKHQPSGYHFGPQMIPGLDLISTLFILIKYRKVNLDVKAAEPDSVTVPPPYVAQSPYTAPFSCADRSPYAVPFSYINRSPSAYKAALAAESKMYKKFKKHRKLLFLLYLTFGILFYFKSEIVESVGKKYKEITAEETTFYEMTDEETALIQNFSRDAETKEKVAAGQLTSGQAELQEILVNDLNPRGAISAFSIHGNLPEDSP